MDGQSTPPATSGEAQSGSESPTPVHIAALTAIALTIWLGVHALRTFFAMVVWNIGQDRSPNELGLIALGIWSIGLLAWPAARWLGGSRPEVRFGMLFSVVYIANQFISHPLFSAVFGTATTVLWLWFLPALITALGRRGTVQFLTPGILLGLAAQVSLQSSLHGLDMPVLRGLLPGIGALFLGVALYLGIRELSAASEMPDGPALPGWGLIALGPYLVLQLTLLTNLGRVQTMTEWELGRAVVVVLVGLIAGCTVVIRPVPYATRAAAAVAAVLLVSRPAWLNDGGVWLLAAVQVLLASVIASAVSPVPDGRPARVYGWMVVAALLFFVFMFLYYSHFGWPGLWPVMAALTAVPALVHTTPAVIGGARRAAAAALIVAVIGVGLTAIVRRPGTPAGVVAPAQLKIMTYNIHEGFNAWSVPDPEAVAHVIEQSGADLVGLQEVGRGWNVNGGPDLVAWLRWRLPQYWVVYAPMLGDLVGDTILSRYPISRSGWNWYPVRRQRFHYGLMWTTIPTAAGEVLFVNTHLSPYRGFEEDRLGQAGDLLEFWKARSRTVIVGDFNATPDEEAIKRILSGGLVDIAAAHGLGTAFTFSSGKPHERIDYIFSTADIDSLAASILKTTASDHLPVEATVRLR